jgi:hypothetical protein
MSTILISGDSSVTPLVGVSETYKKGNVKGSVTEKLDNRDIFDDKTIMKQDIRVLDKKTPQFNPVQRDTLNTGKAIMNNEQYTHNEYPNVQKNDMYYNALMAGGYILSGLMGLALFL